MRFLERKTITMDNEFNNAKEVLAMLPDPQQVELLQKLVTAWNKQFPNGFESWQETHHEIVSFITGEQIRMTGEDTTIQRRQYAQGTSGLYELAKEWTNEFEQLYIGTRWGVDDAGEWYDAIELFLDAKNKPTDETTNV